MPKQSSRNQLRIIGGKWRGRKLQFPDVDGLRPTADRTRETLFNWLAPYIDGSNCLDLFAGSGALGFEAGSRGAAKVTLVESNATAAKFLRDSINHLQASSIQLKQNHAEHYLGEANGQYHIVFLDPPFAWPNHDSLLSQLAGSGVLNKQAWIYLETDANHAIVAPQEWRLHRHKQAGQVAFRLYETMSEE